VTYRFLTFVLLALCVLCVQPSNLHSQAKDESAAIRATALDYVEGYYTGDAARMERALHPELAKRIVNTNPQNGRNTLGQQSAMTLVQNTRTGSGRNTPPEQMQKDVVILDIYQNAASVRATMSGWVDYMHLAKWNGRWVIVNVLWELKPPGQKE
jgi:Putative lumazine-binding